MQFDATGIEPTAQGQGKLFPKQWFTFVVAAHTTNSGVTYPLEGISKNGYPKVDLLAECVDEGEFFGQRIFHTVTFLPKGKDGAGMAIHWLKTINQPYEGKLSFHASEWVGEEFMGYPIVDEYQGKKRNKFGEIKPIGLKPLQEPKPRNADVVKAEKEDSVPF